MFKILHDGAPLSYGSKRKQGKSYLIPAAPALRCPEGRRELQERCSCERQKGSATSLCETQLLRPWC